MYTTLQTCEPASFERALGILYAVNRKNNRRHSLLVLVMVFAKSTDILVSPEIALGQTQSNKVEGAPTVAVLPGVPGPNRSRITE